MSSESAGLAQQEAPASHLTSNNMAHVEDDVAGNDQVEVVSTSPEPSAAPQGLPAIHPVFQTIAATTDDIVEIDRADQNKGQLHTGGYTYFVDKTLPPGRYKIVQHTHKGVIYSREIHLPLRYIGGDADTRPYWHISEEEHKARSTQINAVPVAEGNAVADVLQDQSTSLKGKRTDQAASNTEAKHPDQTTSRAVTLSASSREARFASYLSSLELQVMENCSHDVCSTDENQLRLYFEQVIDELIDVPGEGKKILRFGSEINFEMTAVRRTRLAMHVPDDYGQFLSGKGRSADQGPRVQSRAGSIKLSQRPSIAGDVKASGVATGPQKKGTSVSPGPSSNSNHCISDFVLFYNIRVLRKKDTVQIGPRIALSAEVKPISKSPSETRKNHHQALSQLRKSYSLDGCTHQLLFQGSGNFVLFVMSGFNEITAFFPDADDLPQAPISYDEYIRTAPFLDICCLRDESDRKHLFDFINQIGEKVLWSLQTQSVPKNTFPSVKPNPYVGTAAITISNVTLEKVSNVDVADDGDSGQDPNPATGGQRGKKRKLDEDGPGGSSSKKQKEDQSDGGQRDQEQSKDADANPGDADMGGEPPNTQRHEAGMPDVRQYIPVYNGSPHTLLEKKFEYSSVGHPGDDAPACYSEIEDEIPPNESVIGWVSETLPPFDDPQNPGLATGRKGEWCTSAGESENSTLSKEASIGQHKRRGTLRQKRQWRGRSKLLRPGKASKRASRLEMDRAVATSERQGRPVDIGPGHCAKSQPELLSDTDRWVHSEGPAALNEVRIDPGRNNPTESGPRADDAQPARAEPRC